MNKRLTIAKTGLLKLLLGPTLLLSLFAFTGFANEGCALQQTTQTEQIHSVSSVSKKVVSFNYDLTALRILKDSCPNLALASLRQYDRLVTVRLDLIQKQVDFFKEPNTKIHLICAPRSSDDLPFSSRG